MKYLKCSGKFCLARQLSTHEFDLSKFFGIHSSKGVLGYASDRSLRLLCSGILPKCMFRNRYKSLYRYSPLYPSYSGLTSAPSTDVHRSAVKSPPGTRLRGHLGRLFPYFSPSLGSDISASSAVNRNSQARPRFSFPAGKKASL